MANFVGESLLGAEADGTTVLFAVLLPVEGAERERRSGSLDGWRRRTRPYRPQTNGKVERFNRTLAAEWACS